MKEQTIDKRQKVAQIIQSCRNGKGWTQIELAEKVGMQKQTISKIEGCRYSPNADVLYLIFEVLDIKLVIADQII